MSTGKRAVVMIDLYSRTWFEAFLDQIPAEVTDTEVGFLQRVLPLPDYRRVLDLCCGPGRHAVLLTGTGYSVTGVDRDAVALKCAKEKLRGTEARFIQGDMRALSRLPGSFDAVLIMWQSFGYFDPATNLQTLRQVADALRPRGRLVLDLYHRAFFEARSGTRMLRCDGRDVKETKWMDKNRLHVALDYGEGKSERMEWQLFYPGELVSYAARAGFREVLMCRQWQETLAPSADLPRMQIVLERA